LVSKFEDHNPLNRPSRIFEREGIRISDSTLGDRVAAAATLLVPIDVEIQRQVLGAFVLQADATGLDVLDRKHPDGIRLGTVWAYVGDGQHVAFVYGKNGKGEHVAKFPAPRAEGYLQGDGDDRPTPIGKATRHAPGQWDSLVRYLDDGRLPIDNGECERQIRRIAQGRKNWWYAGSDRGAEHAAVVWSVLGTCALQGVPTWRYLRDVFERMSERAEPITVVDWMPGAWLARQRSAELTRPE
jgi:hypothetical protein